MQHKKCFDVGRAMLFSLLLRLDCGKCAKAKQNNQTKVDLLYECPS